MSLLNIDTKKVEVDKDYLQLLNKKYISYIDGIKEIINQEDYWNGPDAENFKNDLKESCVVYDEVASILKEYANFYQSNIPLIEKQAEVDLIK